MSNRQDKNTGTTDVRDAHQFDEAMLEAANARLLERNLVSAGEQVVFVAGVPPGVARSTNVMKLHRIGDRVQLA